jgi:hypothetical protein
MESGDLHENGDNEMGIVYVWPTDESGDATMETAMNPSNPVTPKKTMCLVWQLPWAVW